jgi:hypothetical protein
LAVVPLGCLFMSNAKAEPRNRTERRIIIIHLPLLRVSLGKSFWL